MSNEPASKESVSDNSASAVSIKLDSTYEQDYKDLLPALKAIPKKDVVACNMPPDEASMEVARVRKIAMRDSKVLVANGLEQKFIDVLSKGVGALIYALALLDAFISNAEHAAKLWLKRKPRGQFVRQELIAGFLWALRNDPHAVAAVEKVKEGKGNADLIGDLLSLNIIGSKKSEILKRHNVDLNLVKEAWELHMELQDLLIRRDVDPKKYAEINDIINRAYTYIKNAMDEIYMAGQWAFRHDAVIYPQYFNNYYRQIGKMPAKATDEDENKSSDDATPSPSTTILDAESTKEEENRS